jgi:hypothetical protein
LTIVGGGLAGLVAAIAAREAGLDVTLFEERSQLGGRARTAPGAYQANWGPHVLYADGPLWSWLDRRALARPAYRYPALAQVAFRADRRARVLPPPAVSTGIIRLRNAQAPAGRSFSEWAAERLKDERAAAQIAAFMGVVTFDYDPGRLSAAFVTERLRRATSVPPRVRYLPGGWATLTTRLASHARRLGARIETGSHISCLPPAPVILAIPLPRAAQLLDDPSLTWTGTRTALLDVAVTRRRDPLILIDLDQPGFAENYSIPDPSLAPAGESLIQSQAGLRPGEDLAHAVTRLENLLDTAYTGRRDRQTWRRQLSLTGETGALDLPGTTWRGRPTGDRGDGVHIAGDMVAAPGLLSEVSHQSAVMAVARLTARAHTHVA